MMSGFLKCLGEAQTGEDASEASGKCPQPTPWSVRAPEIADWGDTSASSTRAVNLILANQSLELQGKNGEKTKKQFRHLCETILSKISGRRC